MQPKHVLTYKSVFYRRHQLHFSKHSMKRGVVFRFPLVLAHRRRQSDVGRPWGQTCSTVCQSTNYGTSYRREPKHLGPNGAKVAMADRSKWTLRTRGMLPKTRQHRSTHMQICSRGNKTLFWQQRTRSGLHLNAIVTQFQGHATPWRALRC